MRFLSEAWFDAARTAVESATTPAPQRLVIDQRVGDTTYRIVLDPSGSTLTHPAPIDPHADLSFTQSFGTARAVATGETDSHQAFLLGEIRFDGSIDAMIDGRTAIDWLHDRLAPVMRDTTFD